MDLITTNKIVYIECYQSQISQLPVSNGQLIYTKDSYELYWDTNQQRQKISDIIVLNTESERTQILAPLAKFYYVKDSNKLYYYFVDWVQINGGSSSEGYTKEEVDTLISTAGLDFSNCNVVKDVTNSTYTQTFDNYVLTSKKNENGNWIETLRFSNGTTWVKTSIKDDNGDWNISVTKE